MVIVQVFCRLVNLKKGRAFFSNLCRIRRFGKNFARTSVRSDPGLAWCVQGAVIMDNPISPVRLSDQSQSDRRFVHLGWNWRRSRSASPAGPHDGQRGLTCHHDGLGQRRLPTQTQHAQVRFSWTSVHSSTKTPHEQKRDPKQQVNAPPLRWAERNPNSTRHRLPGIAHS
jgi:hypothetical protein